MHGPAIFLSLPKPPGITDLLYQVKRFHSFIWASEAASTIFISTLSIIWMDEEPMAVKAQALGGRHYKVSPDGVAYVDQNLTSIRGIHIFGWRQVLL